MPAYQNVGPMADDGNPIQAFLCPTIVEYPDVAVSYHAAVGQAGALASLPDGVLRQVNVEQPGPLGQVYQILGRFNHSRTERRFVDVIVNVPAGASNFAHALGVVPDMWHADYANLLVAPPPAFAINDITATHVFVENFGLAFDLKLYLWLLHSEDTPVATSGPLDVVLVPGAAPVAVPHGLDVIPDLILPNRYQGLGGLAPAGEPVISGVDDTNLQVSTTAAAGNNLNLRIFAQRTYSIQT